MIVSESGTALSSRAVLDWTIRATADEDGHYCVAVAL
jgi:hypothetical protein